VGLLVGTDRLGHGRGALIGALASRLRESGFPEQRLQRPARSARRRARAPPTIATARACEACRHLVTGPGCCAT
jgi:hypothetical protein